MLKLKYYFLSSIFIMGFFSYSSLYANNEMMLIGTGVWLRQTPEIKGRKIELLHFGVKVTAIKTQGQWRKIATSTGKAGWVLNKYLGNKVKNFRELEELLKTKVASSPNNFSDLVEIVNYFDIFLKQPLSSKHKKEVVKQATKMRNLLLQHSLTIIPQEKRNEPPYAEWLKRHNHKKITNENKEERLAQIKKNEAINSGSVYKNYAEWFDGFNDEFIKKNKRNNKEETPTYVSPINKYALLIGNSNYLSSPLKNPVNDATDMANVLEQMGYQVTLKLNLNYAKMQQAIISFGKKLTKGSVGIYYYAGHAVQYRTQNYLIPSEAIKNINHAKDLATETISLDFVLNHLNKQSGSLNTVILDSCRDSPFKDIDEVASGLSRARGLKRVKQGNENEIAHNNHKERSLKGTLIAYSTSPNAVALDGEGRNSPYTASLVKYIKEPDKLIESILTNTLVDVMKKTNGQQTPWYESSINGEFFPLGKNRIEFVDLIKLFSPDKDYKPNVILWTTGVKSPIKWKNTGLRRFTSKALGFGKQAGYIAPVMREGEAIITYKGVPSHFLIGKEIAPPKWKIRLEGSEYGVLGGINTVTLSHESSKLRKNLKGSFTDPSLKIEEKFITKKETLCNFSDNTANESTTFIELNTIKIPEKRKVLLLSDVYIGAGSGGTHVRFSYTLYPDPMLYADIKKDVKEHCNSYSLAN